jgi:hypothetical protein
MDVISINTLVLPLDRHAGVSVSGWPSNYRTDWILRPRLAPSKWRAQGIRVNGILSEQGDVSGVVFQSFSDRCAVLQAGYARLIL